MSFFSHSSRLHFHHLLHSPLLHCADWSDARYGKMTLDLACSDSVGLAVAYFVQSAAAGARSLKVFNWS
jgi:hypothetical protein